jgi:hypothetical protein
LLKPFDLENDRDYLAWRENKLRDYPSSLEQLLVDIGDPRRLTASEHAQLLACCRKANFAVYRSSISEESKDIPVMLGRQFGLEHLDHNWLADDDAVTSLMVNDQDQHPRYIPYTDRPIKWHTDGYYNDASRQIYGLLLHCVRPASQGGENRLLDHDIAYIRLRDENPDFIRAFMQTDVMTIPPRNDEQGVARDEVSGPVFSVHAASGALHMRYTARKRSIQWKDDRLTGEAVACLEDLLESDLPWIFCGRLEAGMGLISNNVLHDRSGFVDGEDSKRLLYRARYYDRVQGTGLATA